MWLLFLTCAAYTFRGYWRTMLLLLNLFLLRMMTWSIFSVSLRLNDFKLWPLMTLKKKSRWSCGPTEVDVCRKDFVLLVLLDTLRTAANDDSKNQLVKVDHCDSVATVLQWNALWNCGWGSANKIWSLLEKLCSAYVLHLATFCSSVASSVKKFGRVRGSVSSSLRWKPSQQSHCLDWVCVRVVCVCVCLCVCCVCVC